MSLQVGILVVSDTCSKDESLDKTGPAMRDAFPPDKYAVVGVQIVADSATLIQAAITNWAKAGLALVVTCGGTGFTQADRTPEAVEAILERKAPGLVHAMLRESFKKTKFAAMSRPVAGTVNNTLVVTLPGSPTAATENLDAIIDVLPHALMQLSCKSARALHAKKKRTLEDAKPGAPGNDYGHSHTHSHDHSHSHSHSHDHGHSHSHDHSHFHDAGGHHLATHELSEPVAKRARKSPFEIISMDQAMSVIAEKTPAPLPVVELGLDDPYLPGSSIAETVQSASDVPAFPASIVDGYAVVSSDGPGVYEVAAVSHAEPHEVHPGIHAGLIARITTGAPIPEGADAVVMVEETELVKLTESGTEELLVKILAKDVKPGENVRAVGSDLKKGSNVLEKGHIVSRNGGEIGMLASVGVSKVKVYKKPTIAVFSTGDELKDWPETDGLRYGQIYDSNRPSLISIYKNAGYDCRDYGIAGDTSQKIAQRFIDAFDEGVDFVVTSGGVSMGEKDFLKPVIEQLLGGTIHFGRVKMKPGKPSTFATVPYKGTTKVVFALPGNPASALTASYLFVLPALGANIHKVKATISSDIRLDPQRPEYHRVQLSQNTDGTLSATSTGFQRSSRIGSYLDADGLAQMPSAADYGKPSMEKGSLVTVTMLNP